MGKRTLEINTPANLPQDIALGGTADDDKRVGGFNSTSLTVVRTKLAQLHLLDAVTLVPGVLFRKP